MTTTEVEGTIPSEPTAERPAKTQQTRGHSRMPTESPTVLPSLTGPPWPSPIGSRTHGLPPTSAHQLQRRGPQGELVCGQQVQGKCLRRRAEQVPRHPRLRTDGEAAHLLGLATRAWCRSPIGHHRTEVNNQQQPRGDGRPARPQRGPNHGRRRSWRRGRRPHGKPEQRRSPRRNHDLREHPPSQTLLGDGPGRRGDGHTGRCAKQVEEEARAGEGERRRRGRDGGKRKGDPIENGGALAELECTAATGLLNGSAVQRLLQRETAIRERKHLVPSRQTQAVEGATLGGADAKSNPPAANAARLDAAPTKWMVVSGCESRACTMVWAMLACLCRIVLRQSAQLPQQAAWIVREALRNPNPPKWSGRLLTSHTAVWSGWPRRLQKHCHTPGELTECQG